MKSFHPKDHLNVPLSGGRSGERDFHGERRRNDTHVSITRCRGAAVSQGRRQGSQAQLYGHVLMENRSGLVVAARLTGRPGSPNASGQHTDRERAGPAPDHGRC